VVHYDRCKLKAYLVIASLVVAEREEKKITGIEQIRDTLIVLHAAPLYFTLFPTPFVYFCPLHGSTSQAY